jgi:ABC-2 type transport system permease protein
MQPFTYLLLPGYWSSRNRVTRTERADVARASLFGGVGLLVFVALFWGAFWITTQLDAYEELGDFLLRIGLSWLFLTFLSFLAFSGIVTALSTFFLSEDLKLLLATPVAVRRLFYARFTKTVLQSSWMVVVFLLPVLLGVGIARCAPCMFYVTALLTVAPFCVIPVAAGTGTTLLLVNVFPARRARDILMLMGLGVCRQHRPAASLHPARAAAARRVATRRHRFLRHSAIPDHAAAAVVLGRRNAVRQSCGRPRSAACGRACGRRLVRSR